MGELIACDETSVGLGLKLDFHAEVGKGEEVVRRHGCFEES